MDRERARIPTGKPSMKTKREAPRSRAASGGAVIVSAGLIGFTLGLVLAVAAGSWVWLDMRLNVGLLIPAAVLLCPVIARRERKAFSYPGFLAAQGLLAITLLAIYGLDGNALAAVPACLFREGFHLAGVALKTAELTMGGILLGGNLLWIAFLYRYG